MRDITLLVSIGTDQMHKIQFTQKAFYENSKAGEFFFLISLNVTSNLPVQTRVFFFYRTI